MMEVAFTLFLALMIVWAIGMGAIIFDLLRIDRVRADLQREIRGIQREIRRKQSEMRGSDNE